MKILLTGATGFIGRRVHEGLMNASCQIHTISRQPRENIPNEHKLDILDTASVKILIKNLCPDALVHLAWDVTHGEFWTSLRNKDYLKASINLCETFLQNGGQKIIAAGTCAEYPMSSEPVCEDIEYDGELSPYGQAKKDLLNHLVNLQQKYMFDLAWIRIFGIYGEGEDKRRFFPLIRQAVLENKDPELKNPHAFADYVHVDEVADFLLRCCLKFGNIGAVNIGTGVSMPMCDWYAKIKAEMTQTEFRPSFGIKAAPESRIPDCRKFYHSYQYNKEGKFK